MISKKKIEDSISQLVNLIMNDFVNDEGLISTISPPSESCLISHFDDIFPFLLHLNVGHSFLESQILRSKQYTHKGLVLDNRLIVSYSNDEYLGALFAYYRKYKEEWVYKLIQNSLYGIKELLVKNKILCTFHDISNKSTPPISSPLTGALLEVLIENRDLIPDNMALEFDEIINQSLDVWITCDFFKKYHLFPYKLFLKNKFKNRIFNTLNIPLPSRAKQLTLNTFYKSQGWKKPLAIFLYKMPVGEKVQCMKENTNLVFALIETYRVYRDEIYKKAIEQWIEGARKNLYKNGFIYMFWNSSKNIRVVDLGQNFSVIDLLCDIYKFVSSNVDYLDFAEEIGSPWINEQWSNGLIPRNPKGKYDHLDTQTDFCISLMRLYELTGKARYREIAEKMLNGILKFHATDHGYILSVDKEGKHIVSSKDISPKYNSLFLKLLILFKEEEKIYKSDYMHSLLKDR